MSSSPDRPAEDQPDASPEAASETAAAAGSQSPSPSAATPEKAKAQAKPKAKARGKSQAKAAKPESAAGPAAGSRAGSDAASGAGATPGEPAASQGAATASAQKPESAAAAKTPAAAPATPATAPAQSSGHGAQAAGAPGPVSAGTASPGPASPGPASAGPAGPTPAAAATTGPSKTLGVFLLLILLLALGNTAALWWLYQSGSEQAQTLSALEGQAERLDRVDTAQTATAGELDALAQQLRSREQELRTQLAARQTRIEQLGAQADSLNTAVANLREKVEGGALAWRIDAVEQLLLTASERLQLARDVPSAITALELADARLQAIADPGWLPLRRQIADDIAALRAIPQIDTTAISLKLQALSARVSSLPLDGAVRRALEAEGPALQAPASDAAAAWYEQAWRRVQEAVLALVTIRQNTTPTTPLLPPDLHGLLVQNLRLQLQAARTALLLGDAAHYEAALTAAADWVRRYLATEDPAVEAALSTLNELTAVDVAPTLPELAGTLRQLRRLRAQDN